ncbi:hypothetical protein C0J52_10202 [Blattella germanica]|nr:hypothetical protein C0J52_10202 [Blattella germanica]
MFGFHTIPMGVRNKRTLFKLTKPLRSMTGEIRFTSWFNDVVCLGGKKMSVSSRGRRRKKKINHCWTDAFTVTSLPR